MAYLNSHENSLSHVIGADLLLETAALSSQPLFVLICPDSPVLSEATWYEGQCSSPALSLNLTNGDLGKLNSASFLSGLIMIHSVIANIVELGALC